ncbi:MAG: NAD(P)H-hydrate dehydratase [Anaerolineae bacterium]|nr:NAD(P)H-hydrate dehydratase [Anaerolineae bacterium]
MIRIASVEQVRQIEAAVDASGVMRYADMMEAAGRATAAQVASVLANRADARVTVLVGAGNNGGDGLVAARVLAQEARATVKVHLFAQRDAADPHLQAVRGAGVFVAQAEYDRDGRVLRNMVASSEVIVDAVLGIGARLPLRPETARLLRYVRQGLSDDEGPAATDSMLITPNLPQPTPRARPYVIAVDCPSGLDCDTGAIDPAALYADETVTFIAVKPGLVTFPGAAAVGILRVATLGIPDDIDVLQAQPSFLVGAQVVREWLPERTLDSNKGSFGKVLVVAGSESYVGAAGLASLAAYRSGAGLVAVAAPGAVVSSLQGRVFEPIWLRLPDTDVSLDVSAVDVLQAESKRYDALLIGPGWGQRDGTREFLLKLLRHYDAATWPPLVIDADALNLLSAVDDWYKLLPPSTVITPHPGEMARLAGVDTRTVQSDRWRFAMEKSREWGVVVLLKGAHTLIADPNGRVAALPFKTDALATAGTGDVLAGLITGLRAQGLGSFESAVVGGYLHGLAGEQAARRQGTTRSVIASDVLDAVGDAFALLQA